MFGIIGSIIVVYYVHKITSTLKSMIVEYNEKINDGWEDYSGYTKIRA